MLKEFSASRLFGVVVKEIVRGGQDRKKLAVPVITSRLDNIDLSVVRPMKCLIAKLIFSRTRNVTHNDF